MKMLTTGMTAASVLPMLLLTLAATTADARSYAAYRPAYRTAVRQNALYQNTLYQNAPYPTDSARSAPPALQPVPARSVAPQSVGPACDAVPHILPGVATFGEPIVTYRPLVPLVAMPRSYRVGRGILGQPKVYVPGQPVRNALRYLTP